MLSAVEMRKIYVNNTETFYKAAGGDYIAAEVDEFFRSCITGLWAKGSGVTDLSVSLINEIYSKNQPRPKFLYWELTSAVCSYTLFQVPDFFTGLAATDRLNKTTVSRTFLRVFANILLSVASADDDVSVAEAGFITVCTEALESVCDKSGVPPQKRPLNAMDYITSPEPPSLRRKRPLGDNTQAPSKRKLSLRGEKDEELPTLDELMAS